jgi:FkbM family methyltransferase
MTPDLIFDIGMHEGWDTAYYLARGFRVVAVDANPALCQATREKFSKEIAYGRLTVLNLGIAASRGDLDFYITRNKTDWSSFRKDFAERFDGDVEVVTIRCVTLDDLLTDFGVPYDLKIDIEGHDREAVVSLANWKNDLPRFVSVEATVGDFCQLMVPLGYQGFKIINQVYIAHVPPLEGRARRAALPRRRDGRPWKPPAGLGESQGAGVPECRQRRAGRTGHGDASAPRGMGASKHTATA